MQNNTIVQWQNSYSTKIRLIDFQHQELIRMTNYLFKNCLASKNRAMAAFNEIVHEVVEYAGYHFATEEKIMERVGYPEYLLHKKEHSDFAREIFSKVEDYEAKRITAPISLAYFLRDWILQHIAVNDKKLGNFLSHLKKTGELHKMTLMVKSDTASNRQLIR